MKTIFYLFLFLSISSCSFISNLGSSDENGNYFSHKKVKYDLAENTGKFVVYRESGLKKGANQFVVKTQVFPENDDRKKILEKNITISRLGKLKGNLTILRPEKSQHSVWFDGKKYSNDMELDVKKKQLIVDLSSPEEKWNGRKTFDFPSTNTIYCFYSQVMECASVTGFIAKAKGSGYGKMNFYIIWDGYPYFHEQYLNLSGNVFSKATLEFDEIKSDGQLKLSLTTENQVIFYVLDKDLKLIKKFWVAQGLSMLESKF